VDGLGLNEVVRADGPLRRGKSYALALGAAAALTAIHGAGVVHRDLKIVLAAKSVAACA
jgi:serine/threonine protein kinase